MAEKNQGKKQITLLATDWILEPDLELIKLDTVENSLIGVFIMVVNYSRVKKELKFNFYNRDKNKSFGLVWNQPVVL